MLTKRVDRSEDVQLAKAQQRRSSVHVDYADTAGFHSNGAHGSIRSSCDAASNSMDDVSYPIMQSRLPNGMRVSETSNHVSYLSLW